MHFFGYDASAALPQRRRKPMNEDDRRAEAAMMLASARTGLDHMLQVVEYRLAEAKIARSPAVARSDVISLKLACDRVERRVYELAALDLAFRELGLLDPALTERQTEEA